MLKSEIVAHKQQKNVMNEKRTITCNNTFVLRLFQTFKDNYKLYLLRSLYKAVNSSVLHPAHPPHGDGQYAPPVFMQQVLIGLSYLHNERNIAYLREARNRLIDSKGYPKLVDFGFQKVITKTIPFGTPEQHQSSCLARAQQLWTIGPLE